MRAGERTPEVEGLGPSSRRSPCCATLSDPGPEPTSLGLESGAPGRPLGSQGMEQRLQVLQVSTGPPGGDNPTPCPAVTSRAGGHEEVPLHPLMHC